MVGAVVDGKLVFLAVQTEMTVLDTIGNTADNCAEAGVVARVIFHGIETEADVRHFSVAVRNHDLYETAAEINDFHISAVCVLHMVYINIFSCV